MKVRSIGFVSTLSLAVGAALAGAIAPAQAGDVKSNDAKFICGTSQGAPATVALTSRGYIPVVRWSSSYFSRSGFSPQARCKTVSEKFQQYYQNGMLNYLTPSYQNRQPVICVAATKGGPCAGVLFTLKPTANPMATLKQLMRVRVQAGPVLNESTGGSLPANTGDDRYLDMQEYLQTAAVDPVSSTAPLPKKGMW
ncbi:COP23 domain-containing protein [Altericista sp. CCNU0014]|uniref:COP23 domain-containing protein n=1 Tax=Altericista sp. CCNU0014 TaxID=3082949 RepID=UPI00384BB8D3